MAQKNSYEGRVGFLSIDVTALADNGTAEITLPAKCEGRFVPVAMDSAGAGLPIVLAGGTGVSYAYSSSAKTVTFKNETGGAVTGTFGVMVLA